MMRLLLLFCAALVIGGLFVYQVQQGSGYILIVWGKTSIEMSVWFGVFAAIGMIFMLWLCIYLVIGSLRGLSSTKQKIVGYSEHKAQQQTMVGLIHFIEGNWLSAYNKLTRSAKKMSAPIINYLAAASCAYKMGNEQDALQLLHRAEKSTVNSGLAVALTQARMQLSNQQYEQALATLERAVKIKPLHPVVLALQQQVYEALNDWASMKKLLPKLHQQNIGSLKQRYYLEQKLRQALLADVISKKIELGNEEKYEALNQYWKKVPANFQQDCVLLSSYARELMALRKYDQAESLLAKSLKRQWHDEWAELYGLLQTSKPEKALKTAEPWLTTSREKNPILLLALGRLCLQCKQWGRAKDFFKQSLELQTSPETYAELARLQKYLGEDKNSQDVYRLGLLSSVKNLATVAEFK
ncbi:hypothetical protein AB835_10030 [Candidatus Endobugula sertula]|uniref:HemY N-terminal domain-containing protein n=1 Tax=Candidatus Endobugula sertula TaxID=62101 RepID=A0A1D2QNR5_9GAMM|nr:hypothetical protein AB835_10030 [Candidatus Endobugula sertula]